jgi:hypothetical protein
VTAIDRALELWTAQSAKNGFDDVPWKSANDVYATIDKIQQGDNPWKSVVFHYQGHLPENPPKWMTEDFKLVTRDILSVLHKQIACTDFNGHWDYEPFMEFNSTGGHVLSWFLLFYWSHWTCRTRFLRILIHMVPCLSA